MNSICRDAVKTELICSVCLHSQGKVTFYVPPACFLRRAQRLLIILLEKFLRLSQCTVSRPSHHGHTSPSLVQINGGACLCMLVWAQKNPSQLYMFFERRMIMNPHARERVSFCEKRFYLSHTREILHFHLSSSPPSPVEGL